MTCGFNFKSFKISILSLHHQPGIAPLSFDSYSSFTNKGIQDNVLCSGHHISQAIIQCHIHNRISQVTFFQLFRRIGRLRFKNKILVYLEGYDHHALRCRALMQRTRITIPQQITSIGHRIMLPVPDHIAVAVKQQLTRQVRYCCTAFCCIHSTRREDRRSRVIKIQQHTLIATGAMTQGPVIIDL